MRRLRSTDAPTALHAQSDLRTYLSLLSWLNKNVCHSDPAKTTRRSWWFAGLAWHSHGHCRSTDCAVAYMLEWCAAHYHLGAYRRASILMSCYCVAKP